MLIKTIVLRVLLNNATYRLNDHNKKTVVSSLLPGVPEQRGCNPSKML